MIYIALVSMNFENETRKTKQKKKNTNKFKYFPLMRGILEIVFHSISFIEKVTTEYKTN